MKNHYTIKINGEGTMTIAADKIEFDAADVNISYVEGRKVDVHKTRDAGPLKAHDAQEDRSRGCGRTTALIDSLPEDGNAFILLHKIDVCHWIKTIIGKRRPNLNVAHLRFITRLEDARGTDLPIFVDHVYFYLKNREYVQEINRHA